MDIIRIERLLRALNSSDGIKQMRISNFTDRARSKQVRVFRLGQIEIKMNSSKFSHHLKAETK